MISLLKRFWNWITGHKEPKPSDPIIDLFNKKIPKEKLFDENTRFTDMIRGVKTGTYKQDPETGEFIPTLTDTDPIIKTMVEGNAEYEERRRVEIARAEKKAAAERKMRELILNLPKKPHYDNPRNISGIVNDHLSSVVKEKLDPRVLTMKERSDIPPEPLVSEYIKIKNN